MVIVPEQAPAAVRIAAIERRITACRASATVLGCCAKQSPEVAELHREITELEAELNELRAPHANPAHRNGLSRSA